LNYSVEETRPCTPLKRGITCNNNKKIEKIMDGYTLAAQLRRTRRRYRLSAASQALYYELVAIANEEGWPDTFKCSNGELCSALFLNEKTIVLARQELIECGIIAYKSGKSRKAFSDYSLLTTVKFTPNSTTNATPIVTPNPPDYIKLKEKPKLKKEEGVVTCDAAFEFFRSTKNKRLLMEKHSLTDDELELYFLVFYDSKVDLGDLNGKTMEEVSRHFYYWLPKHLAAQQFVKKSDGVPRRSAGTALSDAKPVRGVAAAFQFADVVMRE
jgi:hypothetical protein